MRKLSQVLAGAAVLVVSLVAGAASTLDGWPSRTVYLSNDAPFVVFGVTPTQVDRQAAQVQLSFIATDRLSLVNVFVFFRDRPDGQAFMRSQVACGPREAGSWDCVLPLAHLLAELQGPRSELGLRIEAHGDLRKPGEHSTVVVTMPVGRADSRVARKNKPLVPRHEGPAP